MDNAKEDALPEYVDEPLIPYEDAPAYEAGSSSSTGNPLGTTLTIDPTGMSIIKLPLSNAPPSYAFSTSLLDINSFSSVKISRPDSKSGGNVAVYAIADQYISPLHRVRPPFKNVTVERSTGLFAAIGLRKTAWTFVTQLPIPPKNGKKTDGKDTDVTTGAYLVTLGGDEIGVQTDLLRLADGKWVDEKEEVIALAREGGADCEGMPVLSVVKDLDQEMMDFLISAWCVTLWMERLLECIAEAEEGVTKGEGKEKRWTIIPQAVRGRTDIAMSWLPVRAKALDLVRQRDALGNRVLFAQMSLVSSRIKDQDVSNRKRDERQRERMKKLESMAYAQHEKLDKLEDLVYRLMHRNRVRTEDSGYQDSTVEQDTNASETTQADDSDVE
ncbi:hypothetical protein EG329_014070 [Mollisiaceae sp. DMI_Dod_QoI]|nr:hypothetical protein EG329_014070 [Helotiales sp. DMI_Dod_QoI]